MDIVTFLGNVGLTISIVGLIICFHMIFRNNLAAKRLKEATDIIHAYNLKNIDNLTMAQLISNYESMKYGYEEYLFNLLYHGSAIKPEFRKILEMSLGIKIK